MNYEDMYFHLFNAITDAIEKIDRGKFMAARRLLVIAQQTTEEQYMDYVDDVLSEPSKDPIIRALEEIMDKRQ